MMLDGTNPMLRPLLSVLVFEAIVFVLAVPGMIQVSEVPVWLAFTAGAVGVLLAALAAARLRSRPGWVLAWATQVVMIAFGFLTATMFWLGAVFAVVWTTIFWLGVRMEQRAG